MVDKEKKGGEIMKESIWKRKWIFSLLIVGFAVFLMGCSSTELEERCFPMAATVGFEDGKVTFCAGFPKASNSAQGEEKSTEIKVSMVSAATFAESKTKYENHLNKEADYNHLKVLVLEDDLLENKVGYEDMLSYLAETEEFPRNTYVCVVDDVDDLLEMEKNLPQDLGSYLEEYLKSHEAKKDKLLTLGDLLDEKENQAMVLYLPYLEVEENYVEWKGYMNNAGKSWQESY